MEEPPNSDGALIENSLFSLELAKTDSPFYRANISQFQVELDALTKWLDGLCRGLRLYTENMLKTNEVQRSVISKLIAQSSSDLIERSITRMTGDALQHININKAKMIDDINEQLIEPFQGFLKQDVKEIKEVSRSYDRRLERYENATARYAGLSRSKDSSALREEAFVLYEIRKQYLRASFEFTHQIILFRVRSHSLMMGNLMSLINSHCEFHDSSWKVVKELVPVLAKLKSNLEETVRVRNHGAAKLDSQRRNIEEETVVKAKPQVTPGVSQTQAPEGTVGVKSVMRSTPVPGIPGAETPPEKEGYLWKKTIGTKGLTTLSWHRVWFMLKNGGISYCLVSGKQGGVVLGTPALNILLCSVRVARGEDRRFCFELSTVKTRHNILLQAESEDEMNNWITAIEAAKYAAAGQPSANSLIGEALIGEEDDEGVPLREIRLSSVTHDLIHNPQLGVEEEEDDDDDGGGILGEAEGPEKVTDSALPSPEDQPKLVYNDSALKKDNVKLHRLLKSVPANDWVIDAFSCAMQKEIGVQGRVYVTYDRVCFYSNILGFVKIFVAELKTLVSVVQRKGPLSATIIVTTPETSIGFLTILKDDTHYFNLKAAWQNSLVDDENRLRPQELLDSFNRNKSSEAGLEGQEDKEPSLADSPMVTSPKDFRIPPVNSEFEPPPGFQPPIGEEVCGCDDHLEKKELDLVLHAPAKASTNFNAK
ncbi:hypothetical protein DFS34DRAFT_654057 [Phlyctochytrium arcticum]|nr:hypothetical protein DFS34DRAFT_654057 [Phlyctochytrium arcticum]